MKDKVEDVKGLVFDGKNYYIDATWDEWNYQGKGIYIKKDLSEIKVDNRHPCWDGNFK